MRVAFSNYARNMNNKSNTHTTTLINVHNRMKHANTGNDNVILSNNIFITPPKVYNKYIVFTKNKKKKYITIIEI